jgi:hypothetical protein
MLPDMNKYQSNRRRMAWAALAMMIVTTTAVIWDPSRMSEADAVLMMMYGSLSALVGAYFGFANSSSTTTTIHKGDPKVVSKHKDDEYESR